MQKEFKNKIFIGSNNKKSLYDLVVPDDWNGRLIIFIHGYMGYKDWGAWNLVQDYFTNEKYGFLKYNVSHNGGTLKNPIDFDDLTSFAENNYSKEIADFEAILSLVEGEFEKTPDIYLIGHSRGGGIALLQSENRLVKKIATWAAISSIENRYPKGKDLVHWKEKGVYFRKNGRTNQEMPHNYSQYEDFLKNKQRLNIEAYCRKSKKPTALFHGKDDVSVSIKEGENLASWLGTSLTVIQDTQHTFDSKQPWKKNTLPLKLKEVCEKTLLFFNL